MRPEGCKKAEGRGQKAEEIFIAIVDPKCTNVGGCITYSGVDKQAILRGMKKRQRMQMM